MPADPDKLKLARTVSRPDIVLALARVPGGGRCFLGGSDGKVYSADLDQPKPDFQALGAHGSYVTGVALAGPAVVSGSYDGRLIWWDAEKHSQLRTVEAHAKWIRGVASSPDGRLVASVADDMVGRLWDGATGKLLHELRGHSERTPHHFPSMLHAVAVAPDGRHVATADKVGHIGVWEADTGSQVAALEAPEMYTWDPTARRHSIGGVRALAFAPDGALLAAGGIGRIGNIDHLEGKPRVEVFDWRKGTRTHLLQGDGKGVVEHLAFHPNGAWLLAAGGANDGLLMFLDLPRSKVLRQEKASAHVHAAALSDSGDTVYAAGHNRILVYELKG
jgi:WD40 repeat protein